MKGRWGGVEGLRGMASLPSHTELAMPALSPTMTTGNIATYKVKVGDKIAPGDLICDIESDKATIGWEAQVRSLTHYSS
jgi:pyruvate dehydrogenase E2 component (dihydrolipoamide acetyltransferase)